MPGDDRVELVWPGKYDAEGRRVETPPRPARLRGLERHGVPEEPDRILVGDNLAALDALLETHRGAIDLIYIDPPFGTGGRFEVQRRVGHGDGDPPILRLPAYDDAFAGGTAGLLQLLEPRLRRMHELLAPTGSLYVHVDPTEGHAIKLLLDEIFGADCFQREIVWRIGWISGFKSRARNWVRNHDLIFFYTRHPTDFTFNKQYVPHPEGYRRRDGKPSQAPGVPLEDVWNANEVEHGLRGSDSLDSIQIKSFSREKTGWATQKNESLLARVIEASSNPGDLVLDAFAGSGTTGAVARRLGRRTIICDRSAAAAQIARARLLDVASTRGLEMAAAEWTNGAEGEPRSVERLRARGVLVADRPVDVAFLEAALARAAAEGAERLCVAGRPRGEAIPTRLVGEESVALELLALEPDGRVVPWVRVDLELDGASVRLAAAELSVPDWHELPAPLASCEEPLALVEAWCVGVCEADGVLRVGWESHRTPFGRELETATAWSGPDARVRVHDVLGGAHLWSSDA